MSWLDRINQWLESQMSAVSDMRVARRDLLHQARLAMNVEQYEQALQILRRASEMAKNAEDDAGMAEIRLYEGEVRLIMGEREPAEHDFEAVRQARETHEDALLADALWGLGKIAEVDDDWEGARTYYEEARRIARKHYARGAESRASGALAGVYLQEGNAVFSLYLLEEALTLLEDDGEHEHLMPALMLQMAEARSQMGQVDEGRKLRHHALFIASANRQLVWVRHINRLIGDDAYGRGDFREAHTHYHEALRHTPNEKQTSPKYVLTEARRAFCQYKNRQRAKAEETIGNLLDALAMRQETPSEEVRLVQAVIIGDDASMTTETLEAMMRDWRPPLPMVTWDVLTLVVKAHEADGKEENIIGLYDALMDAWSGDALVVARLQMQRGYWERAKKPEEARRHWTEALKTLQVHNQHELSALLACDLGELHLTLGEGAQAEQLFERALLDFSHLKHDDVRGTVASKVGVAYSRLGDLDNAEAFLRMAIELSDKLQHTHTSIMRRGNYGVFLAQIGDPKPAMHAIKEALEQARASEDALATAIQQLNLGYAHFLTGNMKGASDAYEQSEAALMGLGDTMWLVICRLNWGDLCLRRGEVNEAYVWYEKAYDETVLRYNHPLSVHWEIGQAQVAFHQGDVTRAKAMLEEALSDARRCRIPRMVVRALWVMVAIVEAEGGDATLFQDEAKALMQKVRGGRWLIVAPSSGDTH